MDTLKQSIEDRFDGSLDGSVACKRKGLGDWIGKCKDALNLTGMELNLQSQEQK